MCVLKGEITKGYMGLKGLKLKKLEVLVLFVKKNINVTQVQVFTPLIPDFLDPWFHCSLVGIVLEEV